MRTPPPAAVPAALTHLAAGRPHSLPHLKPFPKCMQQDALRLAWMPGRCGGRARLQHKPAAALERARHLSRTVRRVRRRERGERGHACAATLHVAVVDHDVAKRLRGVDELPKQVIVLVAFAAARTPAAPARSDDLCSQAPCGRASKLLRAAQAQAATTAGARSVYNTLIPWTNAAFALSAPLAQLIRHTCVPTRAVAGLEPKPCVAI